MGVIANSLTTKDAVEQLHALHERFATVDDISCFVPVTVLQIALGKEYAGMWSSDDKLAQELTDIGTETGEKLWRMPLAPEYGDQIKSKISDLKNVGGRPGSAITAALFLKEFVEKTPWAHLDIAGPVWSDDGGATGYGVRLLTRWVQKHGAAQE